MSFQAGGPSDPPKRTWSVDKPKRVGDFHWGLVSSDIIPNDGGNDPITAVLVAIPLAIWLVDRLLLVPTVGFVRLAIHHSRSPGWYVRVQYTAMLQDGWEDIVIRFQTTNKRRARRLRRALRREFQQGGDLNWPAAQAAIADNRAVGSRSLVG
ncbi:MAG TPA: hypothetical protein VG317_17610 [Pseudonocardiaceae bacterium]|jgi:hypothetical protein|nr:hypothetical protein [Pseudonocardiaceae bacterium]